MITVQQIRDLESEVMQRPNSENTKELGASIEQFMNQIKQKDREAWGLHIDAMIAKVIEYNESAIDKIIVLFGEELEEELDISR